MRILARLALLLILTLGLYGPLSCKAFADEGPLDTSPPKGTTSDDIIRRFADKEKQFKEASKYILALPEKPLAELLRLGEFVEVKAHEQAV